MASLAIIMCLFLLLHIAIAAIENLALSSARQAPSIAQMQLLLGAML